MQVFLSPGGALRARWRQAFPGATCAATAAELPPDAAVLWLDFAAMAEAERAEGLREAVGSQRPVVVLSGIPSETEAAGVMLGGARGYCHVHSPASQLQDVEAVVRRGGVWLAPELTRRLLALARQAAPPSKAVDFSSLTPRELQVARAVSRGASNREIATDLSIGERTVKSHLSSIFSKLALRDRVQLALAVDQAES